MCIIGFVLFIVTSTHRKEGKGLERNGMERELQDVYEMGMVVHLCDYM